MFMYKRHSLKLNVGLVSSYRPHSAPSKAFPYPIHDILFDYKTCEIETV